MAVGIEVKVSVIDTEPMKMIIGLLKKMVDDERIDKQIRYEYLQQLSDIRTKPDKHTRDLLKWR
jgi:hypothetical protein